MESNKICIGDMVRIQIESKSLFFNREAQAPFFADVVNITETAFRNAIFQILPNTSNPCTDKNKFHSENLVEVHSDTRFILYHPETNTVLSAAREVKTSAEIRAVTIVDESCNFKIFGGTVSGTEYGLKISIETSKGGDYISVGAKEDEYNYNINPSSSYTRTTTDFPKVMPRRCPYFALGDTFKAGLDETPSPIVLTKYMRPEKEDENVIHNGDYVRIRYENQWLSFYANQDARTEPFFEAVNDNYQSVNYSHSIFQIVGADDGLALNTTDKYVLKHFMTSNYVTYRETSQLKMSETIIKGQKDENSECMIETENNEKTVKEKCLVRIKFPSENVEKSNCIKPTEPSPVKSVQFEINTLFFFGFKIPEEYSYKNLKCLRRSLAETNTQYEQEGFNVVIEKIRHEDMQQVFFVEAFANHLQSLIDFLTGSYPSMGGQNDTVVNKTLEDLIEKAEDFYKSYVKSGKLSQDDSSKHPYILKIPNRYLQSLVREFRIFDLIHIINYLLIKRNYSGSGFNTEAFLELYKLFCDILMLSLIENTANRFYNSQFIRIYIHFMSDECDGIFKDESNEELRHKLKTKTLEVLKFLLWDEDLDGLGQLNFYQNMMFNGIKNINSLQTYYIDLVEHISSSRAYNLTNSFRDAFITTFNGNLFLTIFPEITLKGSDEIFVKFHTKQEPIIVSLANLSSSEEAFHYFISAFRLLIALSTSKLMTYYHNVIKNYPLATLQKCFNSPDVHISIRMLCHSLLMCSYYNYLKLPFQYIPNTIQTSSLTLRGSLNTEDSKIVEHCKGIIGEKEKTYLESAGIFKEVEGCINSVNVQDYSVQRALLSRYLDEDFSSLHIGQCLFYINFIIETGNIDIQFLNKAKECLIKIRAKAISDTSYYHFLPRLLEVFTLVNTKMKVHSTNAIYTQVIKTKNSNAEEYARKIINGLKKTHTDSFSPFEMIGLNEPMISAVALRYLRNVARYEESIAEELEKFVILTAEKEIEQVRDVISITLELNEQVRRFQVQKEKDAKITCTNSEFVKSIENLEKLLAIIYSPEGHFMFSDDELPESIDKSELPEKRFFKLLQAEKAPFRDRPFKANRKAISKLHQSIFSLLSVHDVLLQYLNTTILLTVDAKDANSPAEVYLPRLLLIILIAFTYKNKANQNLLAHSHGFISLYYQQKYIDKSCDTLTLFAEVMRDNEGLLEVTKKFIYDITCYTFLGTIKPRAINKDAGAYLATAIMSMHFLHMANIPKVNYDSYQVAEGKFNNIVTEEFPKNDLIKLIKEKGDASTIQVELLPSYYNIREMLASAYKIIKIAYKEKQFEDVEKFRKFFKCKLVIDTLCGPSFRTQFELKGLFLKFMNKIMFSRKFPCVAFFVTDPDAAKEFIAFLINELLEFLIFKVAEPSEIKALQGKIADLDSKNIVKQQSDYNDFRAIDLNKARVLIYMDDLPVSLIWERLYIFKQCWHVTTKIAVLYPQIFLSAGLFDNFLSATELLLEHVTAQNFNVLKKMKKYFSKFTEIAAYESYWVKIKSITEKICEKFETLGQAIEMNESKKESKNEDATEKKILNNIVENIKVSTDQDEQNNIENFYDVIKNNKNKMAIFSEFLTILEYNPAVLHKGVYKFISKFLQFSYKKVLPAIDPNNPPNDFMYNPFYDVQNEFSNLEAEERLINGIKIVQNTQNLFALVELILTYAEGFNVKVIEKLTVALNGAIRELIPNKKTFSEAKGLLTALLISLYNIYKNSEAGNIFEYLLKSKQSVNKDDQPISADEMLAIFTSRLRSFAEKNINNITEVISEVGPLVVEMITVGELFKENSDGNVAVKDIKKQIIKVIRTFDFEAFLNGYYKSFAHHNDMEKMNSIRNELLLALDIWIIKIKHNILSIEE